MNIQKQLHIITGVFDEYRRQLDTIPDDEFDVTPPQGGWSCAEVYSHIMQATIMSSMALERCMHASSKPDNKKMNFWGWYVMLANRFPPVKTRVPKSVESKMPITKISKEEAKNLIIKCRKRMDEMATFIKDGQSVRRTQHPRLGMLTALQWFKFTRIHLQHHLKQLARINQNLHSQ